MKYKPYLVVFSILMVFVSLVFYNYFQAQKAISETRPAPLSLDLLSYPTNLQVGRPGNFVWHLESSPDLITNSTTIYWGYESTPSALGKNDSPEAVHYQYSQPDYAAGSFKLPDDFDLNITFNKPGRVWFRAYARVREDNLWSEEKTLDITN